MTKFKGTAGDDSIAGAAGDDTFNLQLGGDDTATGAGGDDIFLMRASFDANDRLDGGDGHDRLMLSGDYSSGVAFAPGGLTSIEEIDLAGGHSYAFSGFVDAGGVEVVDASALTAADALILDASDALNAMTISGGAGDDSLTGTAGRDLLTGGAGDNTIVGGEGADHIVCDQGVNLVIAGSGDDTIDAGAAGIRDSRYHGGSGADTLTISGVANFGKHSISGIETLEVAGQSNAIHLNDGNVDAGQTLAVVFDFNDDADVFNGSKETDGQFLIRAGASDSKLIGGGGADTIFGSNGDDTLIGGGGDDQLHGAAGVNLLIGGLGDDLLDGSNGGFGVGSTMDGGAGSDTMLGGRWADHFRYADITDSTIADPDSITFGSTFSGYPPVIDLGRIDADTTTAGDQAFHQVSALSGHAGELVLTYDSGADVTRLEADVDGDGAADFLVLLDGDQHGFTSFVL